MANLQASDSCLQTTWGAGQAKGSSLAAHGARKNGAGGKSAGKRLLKRAAKNSVDLDDYEEEQDHLDACFKDSDYGERCCAGRGACPGCWGRAPDPLADVIHRPETFPFRSMQLSGAWCIQRDGCAAVSTPDWRAFHRRKPCPLPIKSQYASPALC